jgi:DedD protein
MGLFSFLSKNKQGPETDDDFDAPVKARRTRRAATADSQDPVDPVLPEKKRARRRLIGATALVLAAIIGLPMIFDSEPKPLADDIAIQIPSRDKPVPDVAGAQHAALPLPPEPEPAPEIVKQPEPAPSSVKADVKPENKPEVKAEAKPMPTADLKTDAKTEAKPPTSIPAPAKEKSAHFIVQVAAIATKEHANELQAKLKKAGIKSYSQKVSTKAGERIRIRVGPFNTKEEAVKMRARLVKLGLTGTLQPA